MAVLLGASMVLGSVGGAGTSVGGAGTGSLARAVTEEGNFEEETTLNSGSELEEEVSEENNADAENDADAENHTDGENNSEEDGKKYPYEFVIAIDAGHQGQGNFEQEPIGPGASETKNKVAGGTRGVETGVPEYQLTLDIALQLRDVLEDSGYMVLMIRESNDVDISNAERAQMANDADADLFIRLHGDGSEDLSANGALAICQTPSNPYNSETYEDSRLLAEKILDAYTEVTGIRSRGIQETDNMSGINWCSVPVTILEMGFMTNPDEDVKMQDPEFQKEMVSGIAKGIEDYLDEKNPNRVKPEENSAQMDTGSTAEEAETAPEEEPASEPEKQPENEQDSKDADQKEPELPPYEGILKTSDRAIAAKTWKSAEYLKKTVDRTADSILEKDKNKKDRKKKKTAVSSERLHELEESLRTEIDSLGGKWSLYFKDLKTGEVIGINDEEPMVAASLIKLFVAGEILTEAEEGDLDLDQHIRDLDYMIKVSDNGAANRLIDKAKMDNINAFASSHGFDATKLNRRMLENNGTENYTSARDCGALLEQVVRGCFVSPKASGILLNSLRNQQRRGKIPAGVPAEIPTANKTGELDAVDNDAAIVWSPSGTYVLCIMSADAGNRIPEIIKLSSMVYEAMGE